MRKVIFSKVSITRLAERCLGKHFWPFFIGLVEEVCGALSLQRRHPFDYLITGYLSGSRSFPWTSPDNGVLYSAGPSCIDEGFL